MVIISNRQRDEIVRYLSEYAAMRGDGGNRAYNARRLAALLARQLAARKPVDKSCLPKELRKSGRGLESID